MECKEKLISLRKAQGMRQEDLAQKIGVSRQAVSKWENGTALPSAENLAAISTVFGVPMETFLTPGVPAAQTEEAPDSNGETPAPEKGTSVGKVLGQILLCVLALSAFSVPFFYFDAAATLAGKGVLFLYFILRVLRLAAAAAIGAVLRKKYHTGLCGHTAARRAVAAGAVLCAGLLLHEPVLIDFMYRTLGRSLSLVYPENGPLLPSVVWEQFMNGDMLWAFLWCTAIVFVHIDLPERPAWKRRTRADI